MSPFIRVFREILILPIRLYQLFISPLKPPSCIYSPSCSQYSRQAILRFGLIRGLFLSLARIFRCAGGLFRGGEDPVPDHFSIRAVRQEYRERWLRRSSSDKE